MDTSSSNLQEEKIFTNKVNQIKEHYSGADQKVMVAHIGAIEQDMVNTLASFVENQLLNLGTPKNAVKRIFNIVIEALQNICIHGEKNSDGNPFTYFIIGRDGNVFTIYSCNIVKNSNAIKLNERLTNLKSLNDGNLKQLYMDVLSNGELSQKGGAGLGFITIALKSNNNIDFAFDKLNDSISLFTLQSRVSA
jgi:Family of unknown function (DUF6272)